jgi:hypothetical protein
MKQLERSRQNLIILYSIIMERSSAGQESDQKRASLLDDRLRFWQSLNIALITKREQHLTYNPHPSAINKLFWLRYGFKAVVYIADSQSDINIGY